MASLSGTFTAAQERTTPLLYLRATETVRTTLTVTGSVRVQLCRSLGPNMAVEPIETYTASGTYDWVNTTDTDQHLLLLCVSVAGSTAYTFADVAGDQILQEWRAADGTLVARITDQGLVVGGAVVDVRSFGAVGDGVTDDTVAIQAAVTEAVASGQDVLFPRTVAGDYKITSPITISGPVVIRGGGAYITRVFAVGCSGFDVLLGATRVEFHGIGVSAGVRYTTTPNAYYGIRVNGNTGNRPSDLVFRDVLLDGFYSGMDVSWMWSSTLDNVSTTQGHRGLVFKGLSVNNVVTNCSFTGSAASGSRGVLFGDNTTPTEGIAITNCLIYGNEVGIEGIAASHVQVDNCILDYNSGYGIRLGVTGSDASDGWGITNNYIAMDGAGGSAAISVSKGVVGSNPRGNRIAFNDLLVYGGSTATYGIELTGAEATSNVIVGNTIRGFATNDIRSSVGDVIIAGNQCLSSVTDNIYSANGGTITDNVGTVYYTQFTTRAKLGMLARAYGEAAPTTGTWARGDVVFSTVPTAIGPVGWMCVSAGTPGTWVPFGFPRGVSGDNGNAAATLTVASDPVQVWSTTLTADRAVTLPSSGVTEGMRFRIVRSAAGAFNLNVGTGPLKALPASSWCDVEHNGSAWVLTAYGSL